MAETEEEERNIILDANNLTMDNFCQSPVTNNTQRNNANMIFISERQNNLDVLSETLKVLTIDSTIKNSVYYNSDKHDAEGNRNDAERDPKSYPLVSTHTSDKKKRKVTDTDTTNESSQQKLLINWTLPMIIPTIDPRIADGVVDGRGTRHVCQTPASKLIVLDAARSGENVFRTPMDVSRTDRDRTTP